MTRSLQVNAVAGDTTAGTTSSSPRSRRGVGLNIQTASVVIIAEPQLTPTIEEQAIARAHRMGQVHRVDVHRLLAADSIDQRILELLHGKRAAFDKYARRSDVAESAPEMVDISDPVAQTELQRRIVESERRRLDAAVGNP